MDAISDVIVSTLEAITFIIFGFAVLWVVSKVQRHLKVRRRKVRDRKKIKL